MSLLWNLVWAAIGAGLDELSSPGDWFVDWAIEWVAADLIWWAVAEAADDWLLWLIAWIWAAALTDTVLDNNGMED